jgi:hypothetical protein
VMIQRSETPPLQIHVVLGWLDELRRRAPG